MYLIVGGILFPKGGVSELKVVSRLDDSCCTTLGDEVTSVVSMLQSKSKFRLRG